MNEKIKPIKEARDYDDAVSIWAITDSLLNKIQDAIQAIGWRLHCEYDDTTYYVFTDHKFNEYHITNDLKVEDLLRRRNEIPEWIFDSLKFHKELYDKYYHNANSKF